jgi:hypothetical protein
MNAQEFFRDIVSPNYYEFLSYPNDIRRLWNAVLSMDSVAKYLALEELDHAEVSRGELTKDYRDGKFEMTEISTGVYSDNVTWTIKGLIVVDVLIRAFERLGGEIFYSLREAQIVIESYRKMMLGQISFASM